MSVIGYLKSVCRGIRCLSEDPKMTVFEVPATGLRDCARALRQTRPHGYSILLDITAVDYLGRKPRFEVVYHFYSLGAASRVRFKVKVDESKLVIPSLCPVFEIANWFEREVYDMFGIQFEGHPKLKRLLMWPEFEGHPLRKDYPIQKRQPLPEPQEILD
jgi:NADH-quinone oxidoreductase subunit C